MKSRRTRERALVFCFLWYTISMSDKLKIELISVANTALATFVTVVGAGLNNGDIQWNLAFWGALLLSAGRAVVKALMNKYFVPVSLGGKR